MGSVEEATEASIRAATHLTTLDQGAVEALRTLARKIDTEADLRDLALGYAEEHKQKPPSVDNVSVPTYLKYCESLGLTPAGRARLPEKKSEAPVGKLALLRGEAKAARPSAG
jgi:hypothetical protein